jgi:hypothetical protein
MYYYACGPSKLWLKKLVAYDGMGWAVAWTASDLYIVIGRSFLAGNMIRYDNVQGKGIALFGNAHVPGGASDASSRNGFGQWVACGEVRWGVPTPCPLLHPFIKRPSVLFCRSCLRTDRLPPSLLIPSQIHVQQLTGTGIVRERTHGA